MSGSSGPVAKGLAGVVVDETRICKINKDENLLYYFGYEIKDLTKNASYEQVSYLLAHGEMPTDEELTAYKGKMAAARELPQPLRTALEQIPGDANPMDVIRTGLSLLGSLAPEGEDNDLASIGAGLAAVSSSILLYWLHFTQSGKKIDTETGEDSAAGHFLHLLKGEAPTEEERRAMDVSLIIYAEHDFNSSTYAARIAASTKSDIYSCLICAIAALRGPLHGGANAAVMKMLDKFPSPDEAEATVLDMIANKKLIFGFGQRAYSTADPRNAINRMWAKKLAEAADDMKLYDIAERVESVMDREKGMFANLDYYAAVIYRLLGLPTNIFPTMFFIARTCGLVAHVAEQRANNRIIHPSSAYIGVEPRSL